ncbi:hypothetical protein Taro_004054, partial [Colocasia esculenta]|nr:hypothetical protein [Colocasia esculenta]
MPVSQYGLYDVGASQILTDEGMTDTQPPQSTVVGNGYGFEVGNANASFFTERGLSAFSQRVALCENIRRGLR